MIRLRILFTYFFSVLFYWKPKEQLILDLMRQGKSLEASRTFKLVRTIKHYKRRIFYYARIILRIQIKDINSVRNEDTIFLRGKPSNSLSFQDVFVLEMLQEKRCGFYLEIGAGWPKRINNTYVLETFYGWQGISIDYDERLVAEFNEVRANQCIMKDATTVNYNEVLKFAPNIIDYVSIDIDPAGQSLLALARLPFEKFDFLVITFEHDSYLHGNSIKRLARMFLQSKGYILFQRDVKAKGFGKHEDWWISPFTLEIDRT
jgi:hypothetical protein